MVIILNFDCSVADHHAQVANEQKYINLLVAVPTNMAFFFVTNQACFSLYMFDKVVILIRFDQHHFVFACTLMCHQGVKHA